jgi:hypothetical protein
MLHWSRLRADQLNRPAGVSLTSDPCVLAHDAHSLLSIRKNTLDRGSPAVPSAKLPVMMQAKRPILALPNPLRRDPRRSAIIRSLVRLVGGIQAFESVVKSRIRWWINRVPRLTMNDLVI